MLLQVRPNSERTLSHPSPIHNRSESKHHHHRGFSFGGRDDHSGCLSSFAGSTSVPARAGGWERADSTTSTSVKGTFTMWAQSIIVAYEESDMSLYVTSESTSESTSEPTSFISNESAISSDPSEPTKSIEKDLGSDSDQDSDSGGLSAGPIAGIAIGAIVGVLLLVGLAFWVGRRKRNAAAQPDQPPMPPGGHPQSQTQMQSHQYYYKLKDQPRVELDPDPKSRYELAG